MANLFIRIQFEAGTLGPGKAELLEHIIKHGSISQAAVAMKMSYRRAWLLVKEMEHVFGAPVVTTTIGGYTGGGAKVTVLGERLIQHYRNIERKAEVAAAEDLRKLMRLSQQKVDHEE